MAEKRTYTKRETQPTVIGPNEMGKLPPQALELEEAVLGAIMLETDAFPKVSEILKPACFYKIAHQRIFEAIQSLVLQQEPIDMHTVTEQLRKNGTIDEAGGSYYITLLTTKVSSAAHLEYHAKIIAQKYLARELIRLSSEVQTKAFDDKTDVDDLLQEAESMLFDISQNNLKKDFIQINPIIEEARTRIQQAAQKEGTSGVPSGFYSLDRITSGWQNSDLIIIAARPAMGKTSFVLSMAKNMAINYKVSVAIFSLEMSNVQLVNRLIMNVCQIEGGKIKSGQLSNDEWQIFDENITQLMDAPIYIDDTPSLSIFELRSKARRLVKEHKVKCIIIDYLQLMNATEMNQYRSNREQEVSTISRSLKGLAKELDIPIIALSQLNRGVESREGKRPQLADLRESGAIEQDADLVCFIHRPEYYGLSEDSQGRSMVGLAEIIISKHRNGATGSFYLKFKDIYAKFSNIDETTQEDAFMGSSYRAFSSKLNEPAGYEQTQHEFYQGTDYQSGESDGTPF